MIINGTILGVAPIKTSLLIIGVILTALFTVIKPEVTAGLSFFSRLLYWVLHIGCGLLGIVLSSYVIRVVSNKTLPLFITVGLTGIVGAIIASPVYALIDYLLPWAQTEPDDWLDQFEQLSWWQAIIVELLESLPVMLVCWYTVNLPLFFNSPQFTHPPLPPEDPEDPEPEEQINEQEEKRKAVIKQLHDSLPEAIGQDIVAISSDLHYLNVHTTLGKALVLGSLRNYVEAFADEGMLVHRSHWVAKAHVTRVFMSGNTAYCLMSTGLQVPVSRSNRKAVKAFFGQAILNKATSPQSEKESSPALKRVK